MMLHVYFLCFLPTFIEHVFGADFVDTTPLTKLAFGSCSHQDQEQPLWSDIAKWDPDYFIWLGDAVYADTRVAPFLWKPPSISRYSEQLHKMKNSPDYQAFQKRRTKIIGVWDDHDYGVNDGGATDLIYTAAVQNMFLHFLDEPEDSPRWERKGLYASYLLGEGEQSLKLILLDPRSQLDRTTESVLGAEQWAWLDAELKSTDDALITIIGTGLPLLTERSIVDKWLLYPLERERLLSMISRHPRTLIISGDSHFGEMQCNNATRGPIFEIMSSGMTHNCLDWIPDTLCRYYIKYVSECPGCIGEPFVDLNFGTITMIWYPTPKIVLEVRGRQGVELHYVIDIQSYAADGCPPRHKVYNQMLWQLIAILFVTCLLIILFSLGLYVIIYIYAQILIYLRFTKPNHPHRE